MVSILQLYRLNSPCYLLKQDRGTCFNTPIVSVKFTGLIILSYTDDGFNTPIVSVKFSVRVYIYLVTICFNTPIVSVKFFKELC